MLSILYTSGSRQNGIIHDYDELTGLPIQTLTIRTSDRHRWVIQQAAAAMNDSWQERGEPYIFRAEIDQYPLFDRIRELPLFDPANREARLMRLRIELMSGQGPDIFIFDGLYDLHPFVHSGFLQDIYKLIDADSNTDRSDFFTHALEAFEINNGLYVLPVSFGFQYVTINANLPQEFIDRFMQKSTISLVEMMEFYLDLMLIHSDELGHLSIDVTNGLTRPSTITLASVNNFVDLNARTSNLTDPRFVEILELIGAVHANTAYWGDSTHMPYMGHRNMRDIAFTYVFGLHDWHLDSALFNYDPPLFKHHIPLVDDNGRLMLHYHPIFGGHAMWSCISIATTGNKELAWEFTQHMIYAYTNPSELSALDTRLPTRAPWASDNLTIPISRSLFNNYTLPAFQKFIVSDENINRAQQSEHLVSRLAIYNEQPMHTLLFRVPFHLIEEPLDHFRLGLITAETAAQRMQNAVSLWLIE